MLPDAGALEAVCEVVEPSLGELFGVEAVLELPPVVPLDVEELADGELEACELLFEAACASGLKVTVSEPELLEPLDPVELGDAGAVVEPLEVVDPEELEVPLPLVEPEEPVEPVGLDCGVVGWLEELEFPEPKAAN